MATAKKPIKKAASGSRIPKAQNGATRQLGTDSQGRPHPIVDNVGRKSVVKKKSKALPKGSLTQAELDALSHQKRGMGNIDSAYVKDRGGIMNTLGHLTTAQRNQLENYMSKASTSKKIYEGLPNIGIPFGISAADIPKGSQLEDQRNGGKVVKKKAKSGANISKAKDGKWMQKAAASIKKRGTAGKCTPITKPGCTGRAKALAKTFKKIAKSNKKK
jgi:hypothetical protein